MSLSLSFVDKEISKIIENKKLPYPLNIAMATAWVLGNQKGESLKVLDVHKISSLADFFIIASATNSTQARSMADNISSQLKKHGFAARSIEGLHESDWILLDFGDIIVHVFVDPARQIYDLDDVWKEAKRIDIPSEYYYANTEEDLKTNNEQSDKNYF